MNLGYRAFALLGLISVSKPAIAAECDVSPAKIALHVTAPTTKIPCGPSSLSCSVASSSIVTQGALDQEYRVYVLLDNNNAASGIVEVTIGVDYDAAIGSGVDVLEFQPCAQNTTPIGDWPEPGSELRMSYLSCQALEPPPNDLLVLGWFRVIAHTPGRLS